MAVQIRVAGIVKESIADGPGIRYVVFAQGCRHNCPGCHNPQTHSFDGGSMMDVDEILQQIKSNPLLDGVTFSGGEPFEQAEAFAELAREATVLGLSIIVYTGYTYEYIRENSSAHHGWKELLETADTLVDGPFIQELYDHMLRFRGSSNQRIIDLKQSELKSGIVLAQFPS